MNENAPSRAEQWEDLYVKLCETLARFGKTHPSEEADFWLIDDDWGGNHHKVEVITTELWSEDVRRAISVVLAENHPNWGVYIDFEDGSYLVVYADGADTKPRWP